MIRCGYVLILLIHAGLAMASGDMPGFARTGQAQFADVTSAPIGSGAAPVGGDQPDVNRADGVDADLDKRTAESSHVIELSLGLDTYFLATQPGARRGQLALPLVLVAGASEQVTARFEGSADLMQPAALPLSGDALAAQVSTSLRETGQADASVTHVLRVARNADGSALDVDGLKFPIVMLVRLEHSPTTSDGALLDTTRDELWERALRDLYASDGHVFTLVVVSLRIDG